MKNCSLILFLLSALALKSSAQTEPSLLDALGEEKTTDYSTGAFKSPYVINARSIEMLPVGVLDFRILHRFGPVSGGGYTLFGLDQASMRLGFDYGVSKNLMLGFGRSNNKKELDASFKYRILQQSRGARVMPVSLIWVSGVTLNGLKEPVAGVETTFSRRLAYFHELIVGRKFSEKFSLQFTPLLLHENITTGIVDPNNIYCLGIGTRFKLTKHMAVTLDYFYTFNKFDNRPEYAPLSLGIDIETGGHVFQLHFSNATGMNDRAFIQDGNGRWLKGEIRFGFNLSRWFQVAKKRTP